MTFETYFSNKFKAPQNRHFLFPIFEINCRFSCSHQFNFVSLQSKIIDMIEIYTDGGCRKNPGIGAWAFVVVANDNVLFQTSKAVQYTTNNEMELTAIYNAVEFISLMSELTDIVILSDSQYSINAITQWYSKWIKTNEISTKKNIELLSKIHSLLKPSIRFQWLRGHSTNPFNNLADRLVNQAMDSYLNSATSQPPSL